MCDDRKGFTSNDNFWPRDFFQVFSTLYALTSNLFYDSNKLKSQGEMSKLAKEDDVNRFYCKRRQTFLVETEMWLGTEYQNKFLWKVNDERVRNSLLLVLG